MIIDAVSHVGPAKPTIRKSPSSEHLEIFDNRKNNKLARSYRQSTNLKVDSIMQTVIHDHLKIDTNSSKNLVKESAEQTENRMAGGMMNWKANDKDCMRSKDEIEITSTLSLSDEHHRHSDGLIKVQLQVQEFVSSPRKESKPCHSGESETTLVERVLDGKVKPFSQESRLAISTSIRDSHLKPKAAENQETEIQLEVEVQGSSVPGEKNPAKNKDQREHLSSNVEVSKNVSATVVDKVDNWSKVLHPSVEIVPIAFSRRKLLILDINGLLADVVFPPPKECKGDINILRRAIFKRPFYYEFLKFCFEKFDVGIWSSRSKKIVDRVVDYLLGDMKHKLLFCWDMTHCTETGFYTLENWHKPLVCKELRKIWAKDDIKLPWEKGHYDESNTMLLDDSPYKALFNPMHCAVFPSSFSYKDKNDTSLGPEGDLRLYVENLANAENMKKYVERHPFGQSRIDETSSCWNFYYKVLCTRSTVSTTSYLGNEFSNSVFSHGFVNDP